MVYYELHASAAGHIVMQRVEAEKDARAEEVEEEGL